MFEFSAAFDSSPDERAPSRQAWMRLYPDEVAIIFMVCGYEVEVSPAGELSRRYMVVHLDEPEKATLKAQARRHGRTQEEEAREILAAELRRLADDDELSWLEAEFHAKSAKLAFVFAVVVAVGIVLVLAARGLL